MKHLEELKNGAQTKNLAEAIDNYKIQLGKYNKILLLELKHDHESKSTSLLVSEKILRDHKNKLVSAKDDEAQPEASITEVLLSLRVNALQIPPEHRRNFVSQLIKIDIFNIESTKSCDFVMSLLNMDSHELKHAISALISVIVSTAEGIKYLTQADSKQPNKILIEKLIAILKDQEDGSVTQRFIIAIMQKVTA